MPRHNQTVARRRVLYIPGYDPIHPRRYRELYRTEGAAQAAISGYGLKVMRRQGSARYGWYVNGLFDDARVDTSVDALVWSDIVRASMATSIPGTYLALLRTVWVYLSTGALFRLMRLRKGPVIAALYPVVMLLIQLLLAVAIALAAASLIGRLELAANLSLALQVSAVIVLVTVVLRWFKKRDGKFFAHYLMHDYAYGAATRGANPEQLEARISEFTEIVADALAEDVDEVLVVGHSSGAHLAVSVLADLIREGRTSHDGPALAFLSLGQVIPMVSFLPQADRLRADLAYLSTRPELFWLDVTAPGDGCAFALCDPVAVSGVAPESQRWPLVISAAFTQTLSPERWRELRWRFFRLHFQYLCAFDRPGDYDYFRITAGPLTLSERYSERKPSKSRITRPVNRYKTVSR